MKTLILTSLISIFTWASFSSAQVIVRYKDPGSLEAKIERLEYKLEATNRRLERLERRDSVVRPPVYQQKVDVSCLLVDSGYKKTFLGTGRNALEAEGAVRLSCEKSVHASYCTGAVKCSSGISEIGQGALCILNDSGYNRIFKGEGKNEVEAEAKAKQSCQASVHASYCGEVTVRCESL